MFLSPMSNTQHFVTTILPAFCLARLAVQRRQWAPALLLLAAIAVRATVIKWLWGESFSSLCLWLGSVTWSAALLLFIGNVVLYIPGLLWLQFWLSGHGVQTPVWEAGLLPFVWGDIIKLILAASVVPAAWRFVGRSGLR